MSEQKTVTIKNINANGTMSNLVGLCARICDDKGKLKHSVYILGKADERHFLVQALSALDGSPNIIRIVPISEMLGWTFYADSEVRGSDYDHYFNHERFRYDLVLPRDGGDQ